jgi:hypothetical protein
MGKLKSLLTQGKLVKVFGLGQLCHPKIIEIIGQHGCIGLGCRMLSIGLDVWAMQRGLASFLAEYAIQQ